MSVTAATGTRADVIGLSTGDVRIPVYLEGTERGPRRADQPYRPPAGTPELREAVSEYLTATGAAAVSPAEVLIAPGARLAILSVLAALPGETPEVLLPSPYWASYPTLIAAAGARPVIAAAGAGTAGTSLLADLEARATGATGAVVINSPRNPDGAVLPTGLVRKLTEWAAGRGLVLLFDQVYRDVPHPGGRPPSVLDLWDERPEHCVIVDGLSKSHALAGLRLGWAVASGALLAGAVAHASHVVGGTSSASQDAALRALRDGDSARAALGTTLAANLDATLRALDGLPGVTCAPPRGGT
jgi:aspartate aminotransferase